MLATSKVMTHYVLQWDFSISECLAVFVEGEPHGGRECDSFEEVRKKKDFSCCCTTTVALLTCEETTTDSMRLLYDISSDSVDGGGIAAGGNAQFESGRRKVNIIRQVNKLHLSHLNINSTHQFFFLCPCPWFLTLLRGLCQVMTIICMKRWGRTFYAISFHLCHDLT